MDLEYDRKFEEMKKYIPFLENMIKRLENTNSSTNPRQAQLDKIKSLRDLLMDKRKRMKMENLLKCEQVLVNLYEKVEQRDSSPGPKRNKLPSQNNPDLNNARSKLKSAVTKLHNGSVETLPEIARASQTEEICVPGSKEPALFQRRPNKSSISPIRSPQNKIKESSPQMPKRNYTRILLSPEPSPSWSTDNDCLEKPLYSRRSPKKSPRGRSPSHKKERKKNSKNKLKQNLSKDLNITLKVPEESLNSLNTKDILSRIINCSDKDVDIDTLRELRSQILGELKETGTTEDISDLILKSYKKKSRIDFKTNEMEEGELSDSESEAIESIYGSLVIVDKEKETESPSSKKTDEEKPRKIQICLVINSDKPKEISDKEVTNKIVPPNLTDLKSIEYINQNIIEKNIPKETLAEENKKMETVSENEQLGRKDDFINELDDFKNLINKNEKNIIDSIEGKKTDLLKETKEIHDEKVKNESTFHTSIAEKNKAIDENIARTKDDTKGILSKCISRVNNDSNINNVLNSEEKSDAQIPLLEPTKNLSEIDILQALKKEILCETNNVLSPDSNTPLLHQPKITKVVNANEVGTKKRISIENYKAKANTVKNTYDIEISPNTVKDDSKKQSLKLTEKECERFNFPSKLTLGESSDGEDEDKSSMSIDDIYGDLAPKSPDHEDFADTGIKPPVIIPIDPVRVKVVSSEADIDMRKILPFSHSSNQDINSTSATCKDDLSKTLTKDNETKNNIKPKAPLYDPRMKRDINTIGNPESPNPCLINIDKSSRIQTNYANTPPTLVQNINALPLNLNNLNRSLIMSPNLSPLSPNVNIPNMASNILPNMTPNRSSIVPNMTPNPRYDITPSRQTSDNDDFGNRKHVYAPVFPDDNRDHSEKIFENNRQAWMLDKNNVSTREDVDYRKNRPLYDQFQHCPRNDKFNYDLDYCTSTPSNPFNMLDCPATPTPSFGRMDTPMTPVHPFGRSECPSTPSHPFGRQDLLLPPPILGPDYIQSGQNPSFGTPHDPRLNRSSDYDNYHNREDDRERGFFQENKFHSNSYRSDRSNRNNNSEYYRRYQREQSVGRNERNRNRNYENTKSYENSGHRYRDLHNESYPGRFSRDYNNDRSFSRSHSMSNKNNDCRYENESNNNDNRERRDQRAKNLRRTSLHSSRADSLEKIVFKESKSSGKRNTAHSFTIDTSTYSSFQDLRNKKDINLSFDVRRQRSASVGRFLVHDPSPDKEEKKEVRQNKKSNKYEHKRPEFRRACSVGREIKESTLNFTEIKKDLRSFALKKSTSEKVENIKEDFREPKQNLNVRSRKDIYDSNTKSDNLDKNKYSPKQNIRDPRVRRDKPNENKNNYKDNSRTKLKDCRSHGIVYSNDNITNGKILGSGYGVKNYKIPKIKRTEEIAKNKQENDGQTITDKVETPYSKKSKFTKTEPIVTDSSSKLKTDNDSANMSQEKKIKDDTSVILKTDKLPAAGNYLANESVGSDKRITRSASKCVVKETTSPKELSPVKRSRRVKKSLVYNSDSEDNDIQAENIKTIVNSPIKNKKTKRETYNTLKVDFQNNDAASEIQGISKSSQMCQDNHNSGNIDNDLSIDDLEIFSDNIASDPVLDNITDLIADLDHDLDSSKTVDNDNFTKELSLERMLENITSPENNELTNDLSVINSLSSGSETNKKEATIADNNIKIFSSENKEDLKPEEKEKLEVETNVMICGAEKPGKPITEIAVNMPSENTIAIKKPDVLENVSCKETQNNDAIVSTSEDHKKLEISIELIKESGNKQFENIPVSTDSQRNLPDSTNDLSCEINSCVSSTDSDAIAKHCPENSSQASATSEIESIGKLLTILQDKTKIKELLGLLGEQSSKNEKIKKKLEKLSEIVSDEDESPCIEKTEDLKNLNAIPKSNDIERDSSKELILAGKMETKINEENKMTLEQGTDESKNISDTELLHSKTQGCTEQKELDNKVLDNSEEINKTENNSYEKEDKILTASEETKENDKEENSTPLKQNISFTKTNSTKALSKRGRRKTLNKPMEEKRLTRSDSASLTFDKPLAKKPSRELQKLQEDIREMFIRDDILSATGIRMCRLAKFVDETKQQKDEAINNENKNHEPVVVLEKCNDLNASEESNASHKSVKKRTLKKRKALGSIKEGKDFVKNTKPKEVSNDPYAFDTDSLNETSTNNNDKELSSESESDSLTSSKSFGSTEQLADIKKKKRKRCKGWQAGIIKPKNKRKKKYGTVEVTEKKETAIIKNDTPDGSNSIEMPDPNCYIDKTYFFDKSQSTNDCRLCSYKGKDIVYHYKKQHPHSEIPLSRMNPTIAKEAITESEKINFQVISKLSSKRYICRFCFKEFGRKKPVLESFFWHVVSMHTGEYKQLCSECLNVTRCPFSLDIPPPPKDKGQLLGYICEKCNYTQISLENLKSHVILRHNDEQTAVCTVNLSVTTKSILNNLVTESEELQNINIENQIPRLLRSSRSNQIEDSDLRSESSTEDSNENLKIDNIKCKERHDISESVNVIKTSKIQSKITFESDNIDEITNLKEPATIKIKQEITENQDNFVYESEQQVEELKSQNSEKTDQSNISNDMFNYPHFKIKLSESGSKEYVCCINGNWHYGTSLLISLKKHVLLKHSEIWDGYCCICKKIVTGLEGFLFKHCLQHYLDEHMDQFPTLEETSEEFTEAYCNSNQCLNPTDEISQSTKSYINVRPLSQLISQHTDRPPDENIPSTLPVIESVISLGAGMDKFKPITSSITEEPEVLKENKIYEEAQAEIMSKKHRIVLAAMMSHIKLAQVFKCAGRFCSFTTDVAEDALIHASTHTEIGGENSLRCVYCNFDSSGNAIDLITHVFKDHGGCQYACGLCFYRAAASQLVNAHFKRVHGDSAKVTILHTAIQTASITDDNMLSREEAVPYYLCCANSDSEDVCKFRTYTPGKFCEHLQLKHSSFTEYSCFMCPVSLKAPADLIRHLKTHGLKLYQCTWCVFGADNENELLFHASAKHPDKQPKAYLRIITNKEGTSEFRVLPLAHLNKSDIPVIEIISSEVKYNPVKEAQRSIDLEKLIGMTVLTAESTLLTSEPVATEDVASTSVAVQPINEDGLEDKNLLQQSPERATKITTTLTSENSNQIANRLTPIIKAEIDDSPKKPSKNDSEVVLCLDSEEEEPIQNIIDLSEEKSVDNTESSASPKLLPLTELYMCANCNMILKNGPGFRKHITSCFNKIPDPLPCAHCPMKLKRRFILSHYTKIHAKVSESFSCTKCPNKFATLAAIKEHCRITHPNTADNSKVQQPAATSSTNLAVRNRRKRSIYKDKVLEPPEKIKKFGPQDVNLLPINPILDESVFCSLCEFNTKVRLNMVRHLQLHAEQQPVPQTAPVNPVPHLETNEKHFDRMVNLASSSLIPKTPDKNKTDSNISTTLTISPEAASRYPKYVPEKHRHTCGAKGCSYISVDESMLKCHWETLHSSTSDFRCVHCPSHQQLDTSRPLTANRIIAHLKMHDATLYACSLCSYYHYKRNILECHLVEIHKGGQVMIVREEGTSPATTTTNQAQTAAPTMDLKPWQCGLCKFKSLLRPEVVEHCAKLHNSKMQYKCAYCAFRTSNSENISKHQSKSHSEKQEEIFYYYYREGSVPDDIDGTPLWRKQSQKCDAFEPKIKSERTNEARLSPQISLPVAKPTNNEIDLNLVKKEQLESAEETIESLCKDFGNFCEPNGLKYKCCLCKNVVEDTLEAMQSHLYEELKYRKWGCGICFYKAFHKNGLSVHMQTEHRQNREPLPLQVDNRIETWVMKLLEHQTELINKNKENLARQKEEILRSALNTPRPKSPAKKVTETNVTDQSVASSSNKPTMAELEKLFGSLGSSVSMSFCCPKCHAIIKEEDVMQNHLENELNKIRWMCSNCTVTFQNYHEAQFHCRSVHIGQSARPIEATRDPAVRSAWVAAVIEVQKLSMNYVPLPSKTFGKNIEKCNSENNASDNSLLVVRYEENVPNPEEQIARRTPILNIDCDEDKSSDSIEKRKATTLNCPHCVYKTGNARIHREHILRHYNLKHISCGYCGLSGSKKSLEQHHKSAHLNKPVNLINTIIPTESPSEFLQKQSNALALPDITKVICLVCQIALTETESAAHQHENTPASFGKRGEVVVKCSVCLSLYKDLNSYFNHHNSVHASTAINYVFCKLNTIANESKTMMYACSLCDLKFLYLKEIRKHSESLHGVLKYSIVSKHPETTLIDLDSDTEAGMKRPNPEATVSSPSKKKARKSTTKLPFNNPIARKSTTKLPLTVQEEYSYYGTEPSMEGLDNVTTLMSFGNTTVPFTLKKLNEILKIYPIVLVNKLKNDC